MKKFQASGLAILAYALLLYLLLRPCFGLSETLYVCTGGDPLNGRANPDKHSRVEAAFANGSAVESVSAENGWVEVVGGETGTVWCKAEYLSSSLEAAFYRNTSGGRVFVRDAPEGAKTGSVKAGKRISVTRIVDGWGYTGSGWVDLSYFDKEEE